VFLTGVRLDYIVKSEKQKWPVDATDQAQISFIPWGEWDFAFKCNVLGVERGSAFGKPINISQAMTVKFSDLLTECSYKINK